MIIKKINRPHKHKDKKSSGCGLCKPHKHGGRAIKDKEYFLEKSQFRDLSKELGQDHVLGKLWDNKKDAAYNKL